MPLPSFKEKAAQNLIATIQNVKEVELHRFLVGLSIDHVGEETARLVANQFGSLEAIIKAEEKDIAAIHGIGDIVATSLYNWLHNPEHQKTVNEILKHLTIKNPPKRNKRAQDTYAGKTFVFTGTLKHLTRDDAEDMVRQQGGKAASSVSKNTDYVVAGEEAGSKKSKAESLGVKILTEEEFLKAMQ